MTVESRYIPAGSDSILVECYECGTDDTRILYETRGSDFERQETAQAIAHTHDRIFPEHFISVLVFMALKAE